MIVALIGFLLTISSLVLIHEYGHYLFARLFKVKVISFSIGFGPKLIKWNSQHNEWCISAIPLGGYVRMLDAREGPVAENLKPYAFDSKPAYQKLIIAFAGPLFNILFAFSAYYIMGLYGVYALKPVIVAINPTPLVANLNKIPPNSTIKSINKIKTDSWDNAEQILTKASNTTNLIDLQVITTQKQQLDVQLNLNKYLQNNSEVSLVELGILPFEYLPIVAYVEPRSPATTAGLIEGDKILAINDQKITTWFQVSNLIKSSPSKRLKMVILRQDKPLTINPVPISVSDDNGQIIGKIGIMPTLNVQLVQQNSFLKKYSISSSFIYAYDSCINLVISNLSIFWYMANGKLSWHNLGGPVSIAKASKIAIHQGTKAFVDFLALISLSLAIMNLLPIPILDGGHILLYAIEWVRGKPISLNTQQLFFKLGFITVLGISCLALYNDFLKLFNL